MGRTQRSKSDSEFVFCHLDGGRTLEGRLKEGASFVVDSGIVGIRVVREERLLGSAGTVAAHRDFVAGEQDFLIIYTDNLTNADLTEMVRFHRRQRSELTMALVEAGNLRNKGVATLDETGRVIAFVEKPAHPASNLASAGIYVAGPELYRYLDDGVQDFGFHVLPRLVGKMHGYIIRGYLRDVGTPEDYRLAQEEWRRLQGQAEDLGPTWSRR